MHAIYATDGLTPSSARVELERKYQPILETTTRFNRQLVSYQANKSARLHRWFKYKEGFSAQLVESLIKDFCLKSAGRILDPFAGVSTTLLVAQAMGIAATGIEVMPIGDLVWRAKSSIPRYNVNQLQMIRNWVQSTAPGQSIRGFPHIPITRHAFDPITEAQLMWYDEQFARMDVDPSLKDLLKFALLSILEDISYTSKDGQFLRWDTRSGKMRKRNTQRLAAGKKPVKRFHKREILSVKPALLKALDHIIFDLSLTSRSTGSCVEQKLISGTVLEALPLLSPKCFDAVITSPPYCNRYDYTRTYALELAFLGIGHEGLLKLRQRLLSSTVENKSKIQHLRSFYSKLGRIEQFRCVTDAIENHQAYQEVLHALRTRHQRGEVNNRGIISMIEGYFTELAFVTYELHRVCKPGAKVAIVNDNVRYSGEIIPVDILMTDIASMLGFAPERIYVLPQRKGNSSQQMGKYGREALRKSILIWRKR